MVYLNPPPLDPPHIVKPQHRLTKKQLWLGLIFVALLFVVYHLSQENTLTGFAVSEIQKQVTETSGMTEQPTLEAQAAGNEVTGNIVATSTGEPIVTPAEQSAVWTYAYNAGSDITKNFYTSDFFAWQQEDLISLNKQTHYQIENPTDHTIDLVLDASADTSLTFLYTKPLALNGAKDVYTSFLMKTANPLVAGEHIEIVILLYDTRGTIRQTKSFISTITNLMDEEVTGVVMREKSIITAQEWSKITLHFSLSPELDATMISLAFAPSFIDSNQLLIGGVGMRGQ